MRAHFALLSLLPLLALESPVKAGVDRTQKPAPGAAPETSFPKYQDFTLPNGLRVFLIQDDRRPTVTVRLLVKSGGVFDSDKPGIASLTATLLNRGTSRRDAAAFARETDFLGSHVEAAASSDAISVMAGALNKHAPALMDLIADAVRNPSFAEEQLQKLRKQTLSKLEAQKQQPEALSGKLVARLVYGSHPYGQPPTTESISSIQRGDIVRFHQTHFHPNNATLAVVGDISEDEIRDLIQKHFGDWRTHPVPDRPELRVEKIRGRSVHLINRPGSVQSNIVVCHPAPARNTPDLPEMLVLNATLGGGFSGRLFQNLRETHGWTYGAYSAFDLRKQGGLFEASAETRNEVTAEASLEILKEMSRIRDESVPETELSLQREYNVGNYLISLEKSERTIQRVQDIDLYGLPGDFYRTYARRMSAVTPEVLQKTAQEHLSSEDALIVVVGEAKEIQKSLESIGPVTVYDTELKTITPEKAP